MHTHRTLIRLAVAAAVVLLAGMPALAADPDPLAAQYKTCAIGGFTVTTAGPTASGTDTTIQYTVTGGTPDHVATFVPAWANVTFISGTSKVTDTCGVADSVMGLGAGLLCHENVIHWNNQQSKSTTFSYTVAGTRKAALTSVSIKKGNSQATCTMTGIGAATTTSSTSCVNSCGNFDPHQSIRKTETFKFENCEISFEFDTTTGAVTNFFANPVGNSGAACDTKTGAISDLLLNGGLIAPNDPLGNDLVRFGDGWVNSGNNSCSTRLIGGSYYTTCW